MCCGRDVLNCQHTAVQAVVVQLFFFLFLCLLCKFSRHKLLNCSSCDLASCFSFCVKLQLQLLQVRFEQAVQSVFWAAVFFSG